MRKESRVRRLLFLLAVASASRAVAAPGVDPGERATERYAPVQVGVARDFLDRARAAASLAQYAQASLYARQAQLDARLAWGMTDAPALRAAAAEIAAEASAIARELPGPTPTASR